MKQQTEERPKVRRSLPGPSSQIRNALYVTLLVTLAMRGSWAQKASLPLHPYIGYDIFETRRTATDHRKIITQISLSGNDYVVYFYHEYVAGSIAPTVRSLDFDNENRRKATYEEQAALTRKLLDAGVFTLATEPTKDNADYAEVLDVRINRREARFYFYTPPTRGKRKVIHDIVLGFARQMKVDQPNDIKKATTITEGDRRPPQDVRLVDVLAAPAKFHGKRISVVGYYHGEFEGSSLSVSERASRAHDDKKSIWRGDPSTFAGDHAIRDKNDAWIRVDGVFLQGPAGHMGLWPGEIVRLTRIEVLKPSSQ